MLTDWSAMCSPDDPVLVVPWTDPAANVSFVDLRRNPYDFDAVPETLHYPALLQALRALNAARSPVYTAKCDVWRVAEEEVDALRSNLDLDSGEAHVGVASYIDLIWADKMIFISAAQQQQLIARLLRLATALQHPTAILECVLRPALVDMGEPQEGYAVTVYVKAVGTDEASAIQAWGIALTDVVTLIRSREFTR